MNETNEQPGPRRDHSPNAKNGQENRPWRDPTVFLSVFRSCPTGKTAKKVSKTRSGRGSPFS
jgi:hypothetical protein